jgi:ATP-binding cassette subfamily F protein 2
LTQLFSLRFLAQQKKERLAREAKEAKDAVASEKRQKQEVWRRNQEKKKAVKPGEDPDELEGVGDDGPSAEQIAARDLRAAAMGGGDDELFEKKMTKEEKKAAAAAKKAERAAAKAAKGGGKKKKGRGGAEQDGAGASALDRAKAAAGGDASARDLADEAASAGIVVTYAASTKKLHKNTRDINVNDVTVLFHGKPLVENTSVVLNYGNRYGFLGPNGSGKSTIMKALAARSIPIAENLDIFFLDHEYPATEKSALQCVYEVNDETNKLEAEAEALNDSIADAEEDEQAAIQDRLTAIYERLDELDAATAEVRASSILHGLGFTDAMQQQPTKSFSGGWRMRVSLARALFLQPEFLLLDEPTNHLDMDAVIWLEEYLASWKKILFFVSHSQDFMNNVCTHVVRLDQKYKQLRYYTGNYDGYVAQRKDLDTVQLKAYEAEQRDIAEIKEFVAKFGHGSVKLVRQAQAREKLLEKKIEAGLTEPPEIDAILGKSF